MALPYLRRVYDAEMYVEMLEDSARNRCCAL